MPRKMPEIRDVEKSPLLMPRGPKPPVITVSPAFESPKKLRTVLAERSPISTVTNLRGFGTNGKSESDENSLSARTVYSLSNEGNIVVGDPEWTSVLRKAVLSDNRDLVEALLCCGVLMTKEFLDEIPAGHDDMKKLCQKFYPDIFTAVQTGNIKQVRCLVNLWHKVNISKDGRLLFQLAVQHSNPFIISLIGGIQSTMEVAHYVLAGDLNRLVAARANGQYIKRTLKHFGHNCAPMLYFAIEQNRWDLVEELCLHFCSKADDEMLDEDGVEIPLLFVALDAAVDPKVLEILVQNVARPVQAVWYQGKNILQCALENQVPPETFQVLLRYGGGRLIADRDLTNRSVFDICEEMGRLTENTDYANKCINALESHIKHWVEDKNPEAGWFAVMGLNIPTRCDWWWCMEDVSQLQENIENLDHCIDVNDIEWFYELMKATATKHEWPDPIWFGHPPGSGQTLLHRAVIRNRKEIVELIVIHANVADVPLDNFGASALHYACASASYGELEQLLLCLGFGEHYVDKSGHDCASYRVKRDKSEMLEYLAALAQGNCKRAALMDPWCNNGDGNGNEIRRENISRSTMSLAPGLKHDKACPHYRSAEQFGRTSHSKSLTGQGDSWCILS